MNLAGLLTNAIALPAMNLVGQTMANEANAKQASNQMDFQERMSSTAHQRQVADLKAAGLNPLLSLNSGASSPQGAQATMQNVMEGAVDSAREMAQLTLAIKKQKAEVDLLESQAKKTNTEEQVIRKGIPEAELKNDFMDVIRPWIQKLKEGAQDTNKKYIPKGGLR